MFAAKKVRFRLTREDQGVKTSTACSTSDVVMTGATPDWDPTFYGNFGMLVPGCIDASDNETRRIFQHLSKSTRVAIFSPLN
jgi:hypothetical protein